MKYQKSMIKIMENLLLSREEKSIEKIIKETKTGRNSAFNSIKWLEKNKIISIKKSGNQKLVSFVLDNYTLQFKYYLDSMEFKALNPFIKLVAEIFIFGILDKPKIKSVVLFGSVLKSEKFNDIDLLLLGNSLNADFLKSLSDLREKIERVFGVVLNLHQADFSIDNILKGIVIYQSSYFNFRNKIVLQYLEFLDWIFEAIKIKNSKDFQYAFNNSLLNLSYVYCYLNNFSPKTKTEALDFFHKEYRIKNIEELKKIGVENGERVFG